MMAEHPPDDHSRPRETFHVATEGPSTSDSSSRVQFTLATENSAIFLPQEDKRKKQWNGHGRPTQRKPPMSQTIIRRESLPDDGPTVRQHLQQQQQVNKQVHGSTRITENILIQNLSSSTFTEPQSMAPKRPPVRRQRNYTRIEAAKPIPYSTQPVGGLPNHSTSSAFQAPLPLSNSRKQTKRPTAPTPSHQQQFGLQSTREVIVTSSSTHTVSSAPIESSSNFDQLTREYGRPSTQHNVEPSLPQKFQGHTWVSIQQGQIVGQEDVRLAPDRYEADHVQMNDQASHHSHFQLPSPQQMHSPQIQQQHSQKAIIEALNRPTTLQQMDHSQNHSDNTQFHDQQSNVNNTQYSDPPQQHQHQQNVAMEYHTMDQQQMSVDDGSQYANEPLPTEQEMRNVFDHISNNLANEGLDRMDFQDALSSDMELNSDYLDDSVLNDLLEQPGADLFGFVDDESGARDILNSFDDVINVLGMDDSEIANVFPDDLFPQIPSTGPPLLSTDLLDEFEGSLREVTPGLDPSQISTQQEKTIPTEHQQPLASLKSTTQRTESRQQIMASQQQPAQVVLPQPEPPRVIVRVPSPPMDAQSRNYLDILNKKEEEEMYKKKAFFMRKSLHSLVFKNASLMDEVGRLNQRIQTVTDERKALARRLNHFEKNHLRRLNTAKKKKEELARQREILAAAEAEKKLEQIKATTALAAANKAAEEKLHARRLNHPEEIHSPPKKRGPGRPTPKTTPIRHRQQKPTPVQEEQLNKDVTDLIKEIKADQQQQQLNQQQQVQQLKEMREQHAAAQAEHQKQIQALRAAATAAEQHEYAEDGTRAKSKTEVRQSSRQLEPKEIKMEKDLSKEMKEASIMDVPYDLIDYETPHKKEITPSRPYPSSAPTRSGTRPSRLRSTITPTPPPDDGKSIPTEETPPSEDKKRGRCSRDKKYSEKPNTRVGTRSSYERAAKRKS